MNIAFIDIETTGLDPYKHDLFEVGIIVQNQNEEWLEYKAMNEQVDLKNADVTALRINRYYERFNDILALPAEDLALRIAELTTGCVLAGSNVHFDMHFLEVWMRRQGYSPAWDYHIFDIPTYAAGVLNAINPPTAYSKLLFLEPPYSLNDQMLELLGLNHLKNRPNKHTALGDAKIAQLVWQAIHKLLNKVVESKVN